MASITGRLRFKGVSSLLDIGNVLYSEKSPGGYHVIVPSNGEEETGIDIELLFNAIVNKATLKTSDHENK